MSLAFRHLTQATLDELGLSMLHAEVRDRRPILATECGYQVLTFPFAPPTTKESEFGSKLADKFIRKYIDLIRKWLTIYREFKQFDPGPPPLDLYADNSTMLTKRVDKKQPHNTVVYNVYYNDNQLTVRIIQNSVDEAIAICNLIKEHESELLAYFQQYTQRTELHKQLTELSNEFSKCHV